MKTIFLLIFCLCCNNAFCQDGKIFYLYGLKLVHDEFITRDEMGKFYFKPEKSKRPVILKRYKPDAGNVSYLIIPKLGRVIAKYNNVEKTYTIFYKQYEMFYRPLQDCDKPGEMYPIECN